MSKLEQIKSLHHEVRTDRSKLSSSNANIERNTEGGIVIDDFNSGASKAFNTRRSTWS